MRYIPPLACCFTALVLGGVNSAAAQQEVYHPGETYDSLQAGQDAYWDAEAQRRALIGRQIWGTPYYGYVRQPIGHIKIWTSRLGYIYKPIYASPPMEVPKATASRAAPISAAPPPPRPATPQSPGTTVTPPLPNPPRPGQEI